MAAGCVVLWLGIPLAWLRIASLLTDTGYVIYLVALFGCPLTMALWGWGLYRVNDVYLGLSGRQRPRAQQAWLESETQTSAARRELMLLDVMMVVSVLLALVALALWFLVFAASPTSTPWPDELSGGA
ncbi:MAG: hypothetical protein ACJ76S_09400 [Solirubrobacteraceae bacterium]